MTHCLICKIELPTEPEIYGPVHIPMCQHCFLICGDSATGLFEWFNEWEIETALDFQLQFYDVEEMDGGIVNLINDLQMDEISVEMIVKRD